MPAHPSSHGAKRRDELVHVARDLLLEAGLESFVMRTVATRAGMRLGNLQYYFPSRDDLLEEVIRAEFATDLAALQATARTPADEVDLEELTRVLIASWCSPSGYVFLALASLAYHSERFRALNREIWEAFHAQICAVVQRVDPQASAADLRDRALLMTSLLDGLALQIHATANGAAQVDPRIELVAEHLRTIALGQP